jgi:ADP-heptose:LPS heptosyltransferase
VSSPRTVCAYYSKGPHFLRMLHHLRQTYPQARLIALVPPGYPVDVLAGRCDEVRKTARESYGLSAPGALAGLLGDIRREQYDVFAVMFHSPKLRIVAALSGAPSRMVYTADNRYFPVSLKLVRGAGECLLRNLRGRVTYARIWWIVHRQHVGK